MRLSNMKVNQKGIVLSVDIPNELTKRHILEMGLIKGTIIKIRSVAPMGDPISIELRGYELAIRRLDAMHIIVEVIS